MPPIPPSSSPLPRLILYYQTHHTPHPENKHISLLPLITTPGIHLTHLILAAIHLNSDPQAITLNDHSPDHSRFDTLWAELRILQASGIKVLGMLGGAAKGSFSRLDSSLEQFEDYYAPLYSLIKERSLDGLDLDVEEEMSLSGIIRLIDRLRSDFGPDFIITLAPVATALISGLVEHNLSGFDYRQLERERGKEIGWYNTQFYCGWGDCSNPGLYELILRRGGWKREKVVVGMVTNPENGSGWVPFEILKNFVMPVFRGGGGGKGEGEGFGGVMGWEYFNGLPGGRERPWEWAREMTGLLRGGEEREGKKEEGTVGLVGEGKKEGKEGIVGLVDEEEGVEEKVPVPGNFVYYSDEEGEEKGDQ
ncbi:chitinase 2 [Podospora fimiseda]|uniref:Chitinase 2 n=1 Tax=Podospora fimiseda TaxID=252190 RepID=A0AAN7H1N7_9PEZI|nr:chitinase 2 [Podospora fimiseda]